MLPPALHTPRATLVAPTTRLTLLLVCGAVLGACAGAPAPRTSGAGTQETRESTSERAILGPTRQLTFEGRNTREGYFSHDGSQLVFQSEREPGNPSAQIYRMNLREGRVTRVSTGVGKATCGFIHPSGGRLLFASTHLDPKGGAVETAPRASRKGEPASRNYAFDFDPHYDLFSTRLPDEGPEFDAAASQAFDAAPRTLAAAPGYDAEASWSPDGRQIVFASNRHIYAADGSLSSLLSPAERQRALSEPEYFVDLYLLDARNNRVERLTLEPGYDGDPLFSPDGKRIVFRRFSEDGATAEIFTMRADGSDVVKLTSLGALSFAPFYHPSGDYVIFATNYVIFATNYVIFATNPDDRANFELYLVRSDGSGEPVRVTDRPGFDGLPAFSPDGDQLLFTRKPPGGRSQLYVGHFDDALARERLGLPSTSFHDVGPLLQVPPRLSSEIDSHDLRALVESLASDAAGGRMTGTPGERIATSFVARTFRAFGLAPAGDADSYFEQFGFTAGVSLGPANRLLATSVPGATRSLGDAAAALLVERDFRPLAFSQVGAVPPSEIVFAGYGIVAPASPDEGAGIGATSGAVPAVDAYAGLDVENRWVMALRHLPTDLSADARRHYGRYASLRYKAMIARDRGARGILFVSGPASGIEDELVTLRSDASLAGTSIAVVSLSDAAADALLATAGQESLASLQAALDRGETRGFPLAGVALEAEIDIRQQRKMGRNVIARLPAARPAAKPLPAIVIGAHVDHLGTGGDANSLARGSESHALHPGADDNASGVAALLEIAAWFADARDRGAFTGVRDVVFAAWSGEELGLLGSTAWADGEILTAESALAKTRGTARTDASHNASSTDREARLSSRVAAYLNLDMVGRLRSELSLFGVDSSPVWPREIERRNAPIGLPIALHGDNTLPTDATTFYLRGVPALSAFTGSHDEYHTPRDTPDTLDYDGLADIARLTRDIADSLSQDPEPPPFVEAPAPAHGTPRAGLRVYLGTIPDYTANQTNDDRARGVPLAGVAKGGPAERAGMRAKDVIVNVDGQRVENIYDYTYALEGLRVGSAVEVAVTREGRELSFTLTPASRE